MERVTQTINQQIVSTTSNETKNIRCKKGGLHTSLQYYFSLCLGIISFNYILRSGRFGLYAVAGWFGSVARLRRVHSHTRFFDLRAFVVQKPTAERDRCWKNAVSVLLIPSRGKRWIAIQVFCYFFAKALNFRSSIVWSPSYLALMTPWPIVLFIERYKSVAKGCSEEHKRRWKPHI